MLNADAWCTKARAGLSLKVGKSHRGSMTVLQVKIVVYVGELVG